MSTPPNRKHLRNFSIFCFSIINGSLVGATATSESSSLQHSIFFAYHFEMKNWVVLGNSTLHVSVGFTIRSRFAFHQQKRAIINNVTSKETPESHPRYFGVFAEIRTEPSWEYVNELWTRLFNRAEKFCELFLSILIVSRTLNGTQMINDNYNLLKYVSRYFPLLVFTHILRWFNSCYPSTLICSRVVEMNVIVTDIIVSTSTLFHLWCSTGNY